MTHSLLAASLTLASWRPFIDPVDIHRAWFVLLIPMALGISMVYRAIRMATLDGYWRQVIVMTVQIVLGLMGLGLAVYLFLRYFAPIIIPVQ